MKIIFALDPFSPSEEATEGLSKRGWAPGSVLRVLSVVKQIPPSAAELWFDAGGDIGTVRALRKTRAQESAEGASEVLRASGLKVELVVLEGSPKKIIIKEAWGWGADLIIMAPRCSRVVGWLNRSIVATVLNHAPCSVEVLRSKTAAAALVLAGGG